MEKMSGGERENKKDGISHSEVERTYDIKRRRWLGARVREGGGRNEGRKGEMVGIYLLGL